MKWQTVSRPPNPEQITFLDLSRKYLESIPAWVEQCINLETFDCNHNRIGRIENLPPNLHTFHCYDNQIGRIENLSPNLHTFYCSGNQISRIENLPPNLHTFWCSNNPIGRMENLPPDLRTFWCSNNQISRIENLPLNLREFWCINCKITELPLQLLGLRHLVDFEYDGNPVENIHPLISRWLDRQKNDQLQVYQNTQSVHNHNIQACIRRSIYNLLNDRQDQTINTVIGEIADDTVLTRTVKEALVEYAEDPTEHSTIGITFADLLAPVWNRIQIHKHRDEIKLIMNQEITDGICVCFTGRIGRLVNCLNGFCADIEIRIGSNEQIGNVVVAAREQLARENQYTVERHRVIVRTRLEELGYPEDTIVEWLRFID